MTYMQVDRQAFSSSEPARTALCRRGGCAGLLLGGVLMLWSSQSPGATSTSPSIEAHQQGEVNANVLALRALGRKLRSGVTATLVADDAPVPAGAKKVHFIRHGEGTHNVAQREWRARPDWDGKSEPYTVDQDPRGVYADALLTPTGEAQARSLVERTRALSPQLLVVSPLRRATQTGLLAFSPHVQAGRLPVIAQELCHETAGKHTCDRRLPRAALARQFPAVSYALLEAEEDPLWSEARESWEHLARRALRFVSWLRERPETHVAVASHSGFLLALFNAALACEGEATRGWFGTGELRTVLLTWAAD